MKNSKEITISNDKDLVNFHADINFNLTPTILENINTDIVQRVAAGMPEIDEKTRYFDRQNSQSSLTMMSLTMLNGTSPYRMMRQVMAEVDSRKGALIEAQVSHAEAIQAIEDLDKKTDIISLAESRRAQYHLSQMEIKINGCFKDIAILMDAYDNIKEKNNITSWDEEAFEREEKVFHIRRCFELLYRDIVGSGNNNFSTGTIEYLEQYGLHPQLAHRECVLYAESVNESLSKGNLISTIHFQEWLDNMANKYFFCVDEINTHIFGKADTLNTDFTTKMRSSCM